MSLLDDFNIEPGVQMGFKLEIVHPRIQCLLGFQHFPPDGEAQYETFKIHFLWIVLRWDWV